MKKITVILFIFLFVISGFSQNDPRLKGIEEELNQILEMTHASGFSVAIVEGDKVVYTKGFGYRDYENKIPADANTLFAIGSSSKAFTSGILGQLRQEDKLDFNDSPIKHIPELRFYNDEMNRGITIKDMMCHRTGLPRHDLSWYLFPTADKDSLIGRIVYQEPFTGLRQNWYYNNFMFLAQGVIAERITGKSWEDNIRERFFRPLGMDRSNVSIDEMKTSSNAAFGYVVKQDSLIEKTDYYHISGMAPAGSINSSANDMSRWLLSWINGGKYKEQEILPEVYVQEAMSSQMVVNGALPDKNFPDMHLANYGYGWFISSYRGHYRVEHGGNIDGFSANVAFFPVDSFGIVVLANQGGSAVPGLVRNLLADRMLQAGETDWVENHREQLEKNRNAQKEMADQSISGKISNTKTSHPQHEFTGLYSNPAYGDFKIYLENDSLFAAFKLDTLYLRHFHYDIFQPFNLTETGVDTTESIGIKFNFATNDGGDVSNVKLKMEPTLEPIEFKKTLISIDVDETTLERYTGTYDLAGFEVKIYTKDKNTLFLFVQGQPEYELVPTGTNNFSFKSLDGFKVAFSALVKDKYNEITLFQPQGNFTAKRK